MAAYSREEMEEMMQRWLAVNDRAQREGNWRHLADFYTEDVIYGWWPGDRSRDLRRRGDGPLQGLDLSL